MKKKILKSIEISKAMRPDYQTGRAFHTTFAMIKNKIIAIGVNDYNTCHPYHIFGHYIDRRGNENYESGVHSECDCVKKLLKLNLDFGRVTLINVRIDNNNNPAIAAPCYNCYHNIIMKYNFKNVYFTVEGEKYSKL